MKIFSGLGLALLFSILVPPAPSRAADRVLEFPVRHALESGLAREKLGKDIGVFMKGQPHAAVKRELGEFRASKRSNAVGKADQEACDVAFLSSLLSLQEKAAKEGGDAVVDIVSMVMNIKSEGAENYSCVVGRVMVNVALRGQAVKLGQ